MDQAEAHFDPFGDGVNLSARLVHGLRRIHHRHGKSFWAHPLELLHDVGQVKAHLGLFGDSVNLGAR
jgi:class 3 adenylate cyclase